MPASKQLLLQCLSRLCDDSSETESNVSVSCSSCAELEAAGCSLSRCRASCFPDDVNESPRMYLQIATGCSISTWTREFLTVLMEAHGVKVAAPAKPQAVHATLDGSELGTVLSMRDKVPGLRYLPNEPVDASVAWLGAMSACAREQGLALLFKISPSPANRPIVARLATQNVRFVVMERIRTLDYLLCMVRDCKHDALTGVQPPGLPINAAMALRAGADFRNHDSESCFDTARKGDGDVLAWLDPQRLPDAVHGLLQRTGRHAAYLQQAGATGQQGPTVLSVEDLTALEYDTPDSRAFNESVDAWIDALRSLSIAPDEGKVRAALLPLAHTREHTKPSEMVSNWAAVESQLHALGVVDRSGASTRDCTRRHSNLTHACAVPG